MNPALHVIVLCGGPSLERKFSENSARFVLAHLNQERYKITFIYVDPQGVWRWIPNHGQSWEEFANKDQDSWEKNLYDSTHPVVFPKKTAQGVFLHFCCNGNSAEIQTNSKEPLKSRSYILESPIDLAFSTMHGLCGEDGALQGFFETMQLPYVGCGILSSAVGMHKGKSRIIAAASGVLGLPFISVKEGEIAPQYSHVCQILGHHSLILKGMALGSSFGISLAADSQSYATALKKCFSWDNEIIIEPFLKPVEELECAILGGENPRVSGVGEIVLGSAPYYSLEAKAASSLETALAKVLVHGRIGSSVVQTVQEKSLTVFKALDCWGMARVDFLRDAKGNIWFNEINTLPGLTAISLYPKLWDAAGVNAHELIETLVQCAQTNPARTKRLKNSL